jgi:maltooligosyltrehalose trehalohydrolase
MAQHLIPARITMKKPARRLPIGAELLDDGVDFCVWAPAATSVEVLLDTEEGARCVGKLDPEEEGGYFSAQIADINVGSRYWFRLDGEEPLCPDPASRFQPDGPHGPSEVVDPSLFAWTDGTWAGVRLEGQVIYEMHVGTFTVPGTWAAATAELPELARLGVTVLEVMPVADFPGRFGWGYDGVCFFAPTRLYGEPDDFRRFVDRAHSLGLAVILDVVYNHAGPEANCLEQFSRSYFTDRYETDWGTALNFDGPHCGPVREFFVSNAGYWIDEFHLDGLRLDATHSIFDSSPEHILAAVTKRVREAAGGRATIVVAENEPQKARLLRLPSAGGHGIDAVWNDDFHHSAMVSLTGRREAYYSDHQGTPQELISALKWGYLFQGQRYRWQGKERGTPTLDLAPARFVSFIQNHDQVANSLGGQRVHQLTSAARLRALTAVLLLGPETPMLFQGQEFCASSPFLYFADHGKELASQVRRGRAEFLSQFPSIASPEAARWLADPASASTFERSKLDRSERERHREAWLLHHDLLALRRTDPTFRAQRPRGMDGAVLGSDAFVLRFFGQDDEDRLVLVNLGRDLELAIAPEPLLAPPAVGRWSLLWSSEDPGYGGGGGPSLEVPWVLPGEAAFVLHPVFLRVGAAAASAAAALHGRLLRER